MEKEKIARINELAKKPKESLTEEERQEQMALRLEYLEEFRAGFGNVLKHTVVQYPDGSRKSLEELRDETEKAKKQENPEQK